LYNSIILTVAGFILINILSYFFPILSTIGTELRTVGIGTSWKTKLRWFGDVERKDDAD